METLLLILRRHVPLPLFPASRYYFSSIFHPSGLYARIATPLYSLYFSLSLSLSLYIYIYIYIYIWRGERGLYYTQCMCICVLFSVVAVTCSALKLDTSFVKHQGRPYVGNVNTRETYTDKCTYMQICISTLKGQNSRSANGNNRCHSLEIFDVQYFVNELHFKCTIRIQQGYF